jgi:hypothetical protein
MGSLAVAMGKAAHLQCITQNRKLGLGVMGIKTVSLLAGGQLPSQEGRVADRS